MLYSELLDILTPIHSEMLENRCNDTVNWQNMCLLNFLKVAHLLNSCIADSQSPLLCVFNNSLISLILHAFQLR